MTTERAQLSKRVFAEGLGTAFLLGTVIGLGIMGERLSGGNVAIALLANTIATGAGLVALILTFGSISGAHFNPAVTIADASRGGLPWREVPAYIAAQIAGAFAGVVVAHVMFGEAIVSASRHVRSGPAQLVSEFVATFGLLAVIWGWLVEEQKPFPSPSAHTSRRRIGSPPRRRSRTPRSPSQDPASDTFAGIRPADVPGFVVAQLLGASAATAVFRWLDPPVALRAAEKSDRKEAA